MSKQTVVIGLGQFGMSLARALIASSVRWSTSWITASSPTSVRNRSSSVRAMRSPSTVRR